MFAATYKICSGPILSAVAARRSRQQVQQIVPTLATTSATTSAHAQTDKEPPSKKTKPSPKRSTRRTGNSRSARSNNLPPSSGRPLHSNSSQPTSGPEEEIQAELDAAEETGGYDNLNEDEEEQPYDGANEKYEPRRHRWTYILTDLPAMNRHLRNLRNIRTSHYRGSP